MREFDFLDTVFASNAGLPDSVLVPPGDDMAVVRLGREVRSLAVAIALHATTADSSDPVACEVEGARAMHAATTALAQARDGIASVVNILAPAGLGIRSACALQAGLARAASDANLPIVGGDYAVLSDDPRIPACVRVCVCAVADSDELVRRETRSVDASGTTRAARALLALDGRVLPDGELLIACDAAIEGRHAPVGCDPAILARKAVLRNLSDVAAMGHARPIAIAAGIFAADASDPDTMLAVEQALRATGAAWGAPLVACEVLNDLGHGNPPVHALDRASPAPPLAICVAILAAKCEAQAPVARRCDARPGDGVYVTGTIGGAWDARTGLGRHLDFEPRLAQSQALVESLGPRLGAMIDVSDGLGRDLGHIARMSGVSVELDLTEIPVPEGIDPLAALGHGEDYELAFTARGEVPQSAGGVRITRIGTVLHDPAAPGRVLVRRAMGDLDLSAQGFEHGAPDHR